FRDDRRRDLPGNGNFGIAPTDGVFICRIVKIAAFIEKLNSFRESQEPVSKPAWNIDLILRDGRQHNRRPFSESRRTGADVHRNIQRFSFDDAADLGLSVVQLVMQTAQRSFNRTGVVILYKYVGNANSGELCLIIDFDKKPTGVEEDVGAEFPYLGKRCRDLLQAKGLSSRPKMPEIIHDFIRIRGRTAFSIAPEAA